MQVCILCSISIFIYEIIFYHLGVPHSLVMLKSNQISEGIIGMDTNFNKINK